jgi:hypothetical protein
MPAANERCLPVDADWGGARFSDDVGLALASLRPIRRALLWLHDPQADLAPLLPLLSEALVVLVLRSVDGRPGVPGQASKLVTVQLGSKAAARGRRWLTDQEISDGAIAALSDGRSRIVGDLTPA